MSFTPPIGDASTTKKGVVQLSGDLSGTAASPSVPALNSKIDISQIGVASGVASLDTATKVPIAQIPSLAISNVSGLQSALDAASNGGSSALNILDYGAVGDGVTDCSAAFLAVMTAAKDGYHTMPYSLDTDPVGTVSIYIPAGDYLITTNHGLIGQENMTSKVANLRFFGEGNGISNIIFKPSSAGDCCYNDFWLNLQFQNIGFYAATAGCTFMHSSTTHNAQRYQFLSCGFSYFKYNFYLEGDNNNSEFAFINSHCYGMEDNGAWLKVPSATGSDQFLNYWFYGCTFWVTNAPLIDMEKGGHVKIYGMDVSGWGAGLSSKQYLFKLSGSNHASGVCSLDVHGLRVEAKNANAALLYSEWPQGNISFDQVDWSSQAWAYTYADIINIRYTNVGGATYRFANSNLAGGMNIAFAVNDWAHIHKIVVDSCQWLQKNSPSDVVTYDTSGASPNILPTPPVEFVNCVGEQENIFGTNGAAVWDCIIGYRGQLLQSLPPRAVSVRGIYGTLSGADTAKIILPVGATITAIEAVSPAGAVSEGDGGSWTVATTEGVPTTIGTVTVSGAMSAGFAISTVLTVPFLCSTVAKATVTVKATNVSQSNADALVIIKGYW
jgi:hypothetical protein